jgi:hypothetical protein
MASPEVVRTGFRAAFWSIMTARRVRAYRFIAFDLHAGSDGGLGLSESIRRRVSASNTRGTATSASWNTT